MAICGRCGRPVGPAEVCPSCRADAPATLLVAARPGLPSSASDPGSPPRHFSASQLYAQADRYWPTEPAGTSPADPGWRLLLGQAAAQDAALAYFEPAGPPGHAPSPVPTAEPRSGRWIALLAATAMLIGTAAAAAVLVDRYHPVTAHALRAAQPSAVAASASSAPTTTTAPDVAAVTAPLSRYFDAINHHDYGVYRRQFILALRGGLSAATFNAEFGATGEMAEQLDSITVTGSGAVEATVTVVSRQLTSPGNSECTAWTVEFYLAWRSHRYLLSAPPSWHQAAYLSCA